MARINNGLWSVPSTCTKSDRHATRIDSLGIKCRVLTADCKLLNVTCYPLLSPSIPGLVLHYRLVDITKRRLCVFLKWSDKLTILCQVVFHLLDSILATVKL